MENLYKKKGRQGKDKRIEMSKFNSKMKRDFILDSNRRMENIQERSPIKVPKCSTKKSNDRLERLKEWQKAKEEAKSKSNVKRKPIFAVRGVTKPTIPEKSQPSFSTKKTVLCMSPKPAHQISAQPSKLSAKSSVNVSKVPSEPKTSGLAKVNPPVSIQKPARGPSKKAKPASGPPKKTGSARSTRSKTIPTKKETGPAKSTRSKTIPMKKEGDKNHVARPSAAPRKKKTKAPQSSPAITEEKEVSSLASNPESSDENSPPALCVTTPIKTYQPVHPSPLLHSRLAMDNRREMFYDAEAPFVDEPAWIPGASAEPTSIAVPQFEEVFNPTFSPFKFGSVNSAEVAGVPFKFTFQAKEEKEEKKEEDKGEGKEQEPNEEERKEQEPNKIDNEEERVDIDIAYFRGLHSEACAKLVGLCREWEERLSTLEQEKDSSITNLEEVLGQIRTTVCQAQLLMRQKLKQYSGLVDAAETQSGEAKTTAEDLQGFWDMVYYQVENLYKMFDDLSTMQDNGWHPPTPKKRKIQKKPRAKKAAKQSAEDSERLQAARKKREANRSELRELRSRARQALKEQEKENDADLLVSKKENENELCDDDQSTTPRKKQKTVTPVVTPRRSLRLRNRSVFSPYTSGSPVLSTLDIPTGVLLEL